MQNLKLGQYLDGVSIWGSIQALCHYPFFSDYPPQQLDKKTIFEYGEREMFSKFTQLNVDELASLVCDSLNNKWLNLLAIYDLDINIGLSTTNKKSESANKTENNNRESENISKVSAFNSDDLINDAGSFLAENEEKEGNSTKVTTEDKISYDSAFSNLSLLEKNSIINTVTRDLAHFLTLSIY